MHKFASSIITEDWSTARGYDKEGVDELKGLLARNAEGVFLWLGLAGESLKRGYHKGDSLEDLRNRLQSLPPELNDLYTEMWRRSNEDTQSNRESGSFYINLLLDRYPSQMNLMNSLAFVMTTTNHELQRKYLGHLDQDVNWDRFASLCKETQRLVENRCAGLFQITASFEFRLGPTASFDWPPSELRLHPEISALFDILPLNVSIVHRSAYDFLTESEEGSRIRSFDPSSPAHRKSQLLRGYLTLATVLGGYIFFEFSDALSYLVAYSESSTEFTNSFGGNAFSALPFASLMLITYTWRHKSSASCISSILPANERVSAEIMSQIWPCFQHTDNEGIKLEKTLDMVREYFSGGNNHFKLLEEPVGHYLAREDCGYRFVKDIDPEELEPELTISGFGPDYVFGSEVDSDQEEEVED
ncbi:hypothetical protein MCOR08_010949 [Pyricularia oryzae]|nr:hypothetical protein MCOR08_010949 [Pyricularia oryzae]